MARARNIKPAFFTNEQLSDSCPLGRLLFIGLWTLADYKGDLEWKEKTIKIQILPWDNCDINSLAITLDKSGLVRFYSDGIKTLLHIPNFVKHQNPHKNEKEKGSDIPTYCESMRQAIDLKGLTINRDKSGLKPEYSHSDRADSLLLNPYSLNPVIPQSQQVTPMATPKKLATRLPNEWKPTQEHWDAAIKINSELAPKLNLIAEKFKNYWVSKSGKDATKMDWMATWKNWVIREAENAKTGSSTKSNYGTQRAELFDAVTDPTRATNF
jgi:hypothetical protein